MLRRGDEAERQRRVAGDVAVLPGRDRRRLDLVRVGEDLGGLAEVVAGAQHADVGVDQLRGLLEALRRSTSPSTRSGRWNSQDVSPSAKKFLQRLTVRAGRLVSRSVAAVSLVMSTSNSWKRVSEPSASGLDVYSAFFRFCSVNCSLSTIKMPFGAQVADVDLERRRIHGDQHVEVVARREDLAAGEVQLKAGDAGERARGRADLGRESRAAC